MRVQVVGSARGDEEMEYWRRRSWGSMERKVEKGMFRSGNCSRRSSGLTRLSLISGLY